MFRGHGNYREKLLEHGDGWKERGRGDGLSLLPPGLKERDESGKQVAPAAPAAILVSASAVGGLNG